MKKKWQRAVVFIIAIAIIAVMVLSLVASSGI
jgi:hypothetical protein